MEIIIYEDTVHHTRQTGIHAWCEYGHAVFDNRGPGPHPAIERPYLSPEDREAKQYAEEYVRERTTT